MKITLLQEVADEATARIRARDVPESFWEEAANEVAEEMSTDPTLGRWFDAQIRRSLEAKGTVDAGEIADISLGDELLERRAGLTGRAEEIIRRVINKLVDEDLDRRVANGSVVEVAMENGEIGYERKDDA